MGSCNTTAFGAAGGQKMASFLYVLLVVGTLVNESRGWVKEWQPNTDWQNGINWANQQLPCAQSLIQLPRDAVVSLYLAGRTSWGTLILPDRGELVLENDWSLVTTGEEVTCRDEAPVRGFTNWRPHSWFHPANWAIRQADVSPDAVPHSERIPCARDTVLLPDRHGFLIDFNGWSWPLTIGALKYGQQVISPLQSDLFLRDSSLQYRLVNTPSSLLLNGTQCDDPLGCLCGNSNTKVMQLVCSNAASLCQDQPTCRDAFRPPGHCCDMCGAMIEITVHAETFSKDPLNRLVFSFGESYHPPLSMHLYRTAEDALHLVVTDNTTNERSIQMGRIIDDFFQDAANRRLYGIAATRIKRSGISQPSSRHWSPSQSDRVANGLITVLVSVILIGLATTTYCLYHRRSSGWRMERWLRPVMGSSNDEMTAAFARFQNDSAGNVEIAIPDSLYPISDEAQPEAKLDAAGATAPSTAEDPQVFPPKSQQAKQHPVAGPSHSAPISGADSRKTVAWRKLTRAFVNPLFGEPGAGSPLSARWSMSSLIKSSATEENPIYDVVIPQHHQRQAGVEFIDALATAVDETAPAATAATETATAETAGAATTVAVVETESSIVETSPSSALPEDSIINPALPECDVPDSTDATLPVSATPSPDPETVQPCQENENSSELTNRFDHVQSDAASSSSPGWKGRKLSKMWNRAAAKLTSTLGPTTDANPADFQNAASSSPFDDRIQLTLAEETLDDEPATSDQ